VLAAVVHYMLTCILSNQRSAAVALLAVLAFPHSFTIG